MSDLPETQPVLYSTAGGVATVTINRPDRRNALSPEVWRGILTALERADAAEDVRVVVLTGAGDKAFCAGGDLGGMSGQGTVAQHSARAELGELFRRIRSLRVPVVARVNGHALAGGFGLMLACDLVVAADDVEVGTPEVNVGLWPFMITAVIQRDVPRKMAMEMMLTGKRIPIAEAARWGFVNKVVTRAQLDPAVERIAKDVSSNSAAIAELGKGSFYRAEDMAFDEALDYLAGMLTICLQTEDAAEGISAFFQKRAPQWKGR